MTDVFLRIAERLGIPTVAKRGQRSGAGDG